MGTNYQKFHNPPSYTGETGPAGMEPPAYPFPSAPAIINGQAPFVQPPKKELKSWFSLRRLVLMELILALAMIFFESIIDGVTSTSRLLPYHPGPCSLGTGIWVGILGLITAGLGWGAFRTPHGNKCLMVANFVMSIISAVADGVMIIFAGICLGTLPWYTRGSYEYNSDIGRTIFREASAETVALGRGLMAAESFLLLAAITHLISSIVSTAFICRNWCQESQPAVAVVYYPTGANQPIGNGNETDPCRIAVPSGAHVIFVPVGNGGQAVFPPSAAQPPQPELRNVPGGLVI